MAKQFSLKSYVSGMAKQFFLSSCFSGSFTFDKLMSKAGELADKHNDTELDDMLHDARVRFAELDALVYAIERKLDKE